MWRLKQLHKELNQSFDSEDIYTIERQDENVILTPKKDHKFTFIWMPGLCGKASNYLALFNNPKLTPLTGNTKVVMLSAPQRIVSILNNLQANCWMDMSLIDENTDDLQQIFNIDQANESREYIRKKIEQEIAILKDSQKIYIGGMSQGCAMALYTALESEFKLGGLIGFSGYLLSKVEIKNPNLRILLLHGEKDNEIPWEFAKQSFEKIKNLVNLKILSFKNLEHELALEEIAIMKECFLNWIK